MDRLVVMDDEVELGRFVGRVAESVGYEVKVISRVQDFKIVVDHWKPNVIILDLAMPETDGLELLRWLASENSKIRIVIMSGYDARVVEAAKRIGLERGLDISFAFSKPVRVQDLKEKLEAIKQKQPDPGGLEELERGISGRELFLLYQPKVVLHTGALQGVEALVRWRHPQHGVVMPEKFVTLAEETGLIDNLMDYVVAEAVHQQKLWAKTGLDIQMAVNLSAHNLRNGNLADRLTLLCATADVPPHRITLEINESTAMNNTLEALDILTRLRLKGFKLSIDDFGTGFSSLSRLRRLPVTEIKIDCSFVSEMLNSQDAFVIVRSVIALAHSMNLTCIAEGVESEEHYKALMELGCDLGQGFAIAKPMPAEDVVEWNQRLNPPTEATR